MSGLAKNPEERPKSCKAVLGVLHSTVNRIKESPNRISFSLNSPLSRNMGRTVQLDADVYLLEEEAKQLFTQKSNLKNYF